MSRYKLHTSVLQTIGTLKSEKLKNAVREFINYTPIDFTVIRNGAYRTASMQNELFELGYSKCDGFKIKSAHQSGLAVDLVPWINGKPVWNKEIAQGLALAFIGFCHLKGIELVSGVDWNHDGDLSDGWDPYHFEVKE